MQHLIAGLFENSKLAGDAVAELKEKGFTDDVSVIAQKWDDTEVESHTIKQDVKDGAMTGGAVGAVVGGLAGLIAGVSTLVLPGIGTVLVAGPLAAALSATGAATGAVAGGLIGALVDAGISENQAKRYEEAIQHGQVLVAVTTDDEHSRQAVNILLAHGAVETNVEKE